MRRWLVAGLLLVQGAATQAAVDDALLAQAQAEQPAVVQTLQQLVDIETGGGDREGLEAMAGLLQARLEALGAQVSRHAGSGGDNIVASLRGSGRGRVLLMAHADTVYPRGTLSRLPFRIDGPRAFGPGVADAKGGVALLLHAMKLLAQRRDGFAQVTALVNNDEERGSGGSRALIVQQAGLHDAVLSFEPGFALRESFARGTSGVAQVQVRVRGRAAHAGGSAQVGVNALVEAADLVLRTQDLDRLLPGQRLNWTLMQAGAVSNIIPEEATLSADVRYVRPEDLATLEQALRERAARQRLPEARLDIRVTPGRPAFTADAASLALMQRAITLYREIGGDITIIDRGGGGTDAGYAAQAGKPVLESLGLPGFGAHAGAAEYVMLDAIPRRLYLAVKLALDVASGMR